MVKKDKVLITGGAGFVGTNLALSLKHDYDIRIIDNLSSGTTNLKFIENEAEVVIGDILKHDDCCQALEGVDYVVHLAAKGNVVESMQDPLDNLNVNVLGTATLLNACKTVDLKRFIFSSTGGALMGNCELPVSEQSIPRPISPYGASKLACEGYISAYAYGFGIPATVLRFGNVYGPYCNHKKGVFNKIAEAILADKPVSIYGDGKASRDYVHVSDICWGIQLALTTPQEPLEVYHIGTEVETNLLELIGFFEQVVDKKIEKLFFPERPGEVRLNFATFKRAQQKLGFVPEKQLADGIREFYRWFAENADEV